MDRVDKLLYGVLVLVGTVMIVLSAPGLESLSPWGNESVSPSDVDARVQVAPEIPAIEMSVSVDGLSQLDPATEADLTPQ